MDKKTLIAIGVIGALGIGTYTIIVSRNKNNNTNNTGGIKPLPTPTTTPSKTNQSLFCKYLNIGCTASGKINL
jgi:hypothetical protein